MSAIVAAVASLVGVVIGVVLNPWMQGRAETRKVFGDAMSALALVAAAQSYPATTGVEGNVDPDASAELRRLMHGEFIAAMLEARRALAQVSPLCPGVRPFLPRWKDVQSAEVQSELETILRRGLRRRLYAPFF